MYVLRQSVLHKQDWYNHSMNKQRYKSVWDAIEDMFGVIANIKSRTELMRGKIDVFLQDILVNMLAAAEIRLEMRLKKAA